MKYKSIIICLYFFYTLKKKKKKESEKKFTIFSHFADVAKPDNHHQQDLAKFGYRPDINVNEFKNPYIYISATCGKCCKFFESTLFIQIKSFKILHN